MDNTDATLRSILTEHKEGAKIYTSLPKEGNSEMLIVQSVGQN
jgi:hypothetical protein